MKIALCCIVKNENNYLVEYVEHYLKLGFDTIIIYDNNDENGERPIDVLKKYVIDKSVIIEDVRGRIGMQLASYNACYKKYSDNYDWIAFFDADELLQLNVNKNIQEYLSNSFFKNFNCIRIHWKCFTDSGKIMVKDGNYSFNRFTKPTTWRNVATKSIVKTKNNIEFISSHGPNDYVGINSDLINELNKKHIKCCQNNGTKCSNTMDVPIVNYDYAQINHYYTKSLEEYFCNKMKRQHPQIEEKVFALSFRNYFCVNRMTCKKLFYKNYLQSDNHAIKQLNLALYKICSYILPDWSPIQKILIFPFTISKKVRQFTKKAIKKSLCVLKVLPMKNIILFESMPDFADSTIYVYNELIKRGYGKKYKFIWLCHDENHKESFKKICKINISRNRAKNFYYQYVSKYIIVNNYIIYRKRKTQKIIFIQHGGTTKFTRNYYTFKGDVTAVVNLCPYLNKAEAYQLDVPLQKVYGLGLPRNDAIIDSKVELHKLFKFDGKIIFYYPTVKSWKDGKSHGSSNISDLLITQNDYEIINSNLRNNNLLLVIKLHWSSNPIYSSKKRYSNILFVDDCFFANKNTSSYSCLSKADALLTDYSSVFYDYLLADKPIGFIWTDFEQYSSNPGLVKEFVYTTSRCGSHIHTRDELFEFFDDIANGNDQKKDDRKYVRSLIFPYANKRSTQRVTDFIIKTFDLKTDV